MSCNRQGCLDPSAHVHLRRADEMAIANVLAAEWAEREQRKAARNHQSAKTVDRIGADTSESD